MTIWAGPAVLALVLPAAPHPQTTDAAWNLPRNVAPTTPNQTQHRDGHLLTLVEMVATVAVIEESWRKYEYVGFEEYPQQLAKTTLVLALVLVRSPSRQVPRWG